MHIFFCIVRFIIFLIGAIQYLFNLEKDNNQKAVLPSFGFLSSLNVETFYCNFDHLFTLYLEADKTKNNNQLELDALKDYKLCSSKSRILGYFLFIPLFTFYWRIL